MASQSDEAAKATGSAQYGQTEYSV